MPDVRGSAGDYPEDLTTERTDQKLASFILYFVIETIALLVVLFGGLLTTV